MTKKWIESAESLISKPALWAELDYTTELDANLSRTLEWEPTRNGTAHGLVAWFDAELLPGIGFSNAPGLPEALYGNLFLPFQEPLSCKKGDVVEVRLRAQLLVDEYVWQWRTRRSPAAPDELPVSFSQSSLGGLALSPDRFRRFSENHVPELSDEGRTDLLILEAMDGRATVGEIAKHLQEALPHRFPSYNDAMKRVSALAAAHSQ